MELEQIQKRVQWLDDERRKDKNIITYLQEQLNNYEERLAGSLQKNEELLSEVTHLKTIITRMDKYDESMAVHRAELKKDIKAIENQTAQRDNEIMSVLRAEMHSYESHIDEFRKEISITRDLKNGIN